jgi:hypothetical protein
MPGVHYVNASFAQVIEIDRAFTADDRFTQQLSYLRARRVQRHFAAPGLRKGAASESEQEKRGHWQMKFVGTDHCAPEYD